MIQIYYPEIDQKQTPEELLLSPIIIKNLHGKIKTMQKNWLDFSFQINTLKVQK